jgi:GAF domain-containing protein
MDAIGRERWSQAFPWLTGTRLGLRLQEVLRAAELAQRSSAMQLRAMGKADLAARADGYAARVRLDLDNPLGARWLHGMECELRAASTVEVLLDRALTGALRAMHATHGNIQLADPVTGALRIVVQQGFNQEFLDYFGAVSDTASACGRAAIEGSQVVIPDVRCDPGFEPHRGIAAAAGFRAVQSTPLTDRSGQLRGVLSTHYCDPGRPPEEGLELMKTYGLLIADALAVPG